MTDNRALRVQEVSVDLGGRRIISDISVTIPYGKITGFIGPNGSGKSSLLRCLYGSLSPQSGFVAFGDRPLSDLSPKATAQLVAVVTQETAPIFAFTVEEVVALGRIAHQKGMGRLRPKDHAIIDQAMHQTGTQTLRNRIFATLSGGEKQRVMLARAIAQQPHYLLLDEPTNHLDIRYQLELLALIRALNITTVIALHDLNLAWRFCDQVLLMRGGSTLAVGTPRQVLTPSHCSTAFDVHAHALVDPFDGEQMLRFTLGPVQ